MAWIGYGFWFIHITTETDKIGLIGGQSIFEELSASYPSDVLVIENDVITVVTVGIQGPPGPSRGGGGANIDHEFAWGDATPVDIISVLAGQTVFRTIIDLVETFDGSGAALSVGIEGSAGLLVSTFENDTSQSGTYELAPNWTAQTDATIKLFITPGSGCTQGRGFIRLIF